MQHSALPRIAFSRYSSTHPLPCALPSPAGEGEVVGLGQGLKARGNVEKWLGDVEGRMVVSLRKAARAVVAAYAETARSEWVLAHPAQLVIAVSQVYWCASVERALRSGAATEGLHEFYKVRGGRAAEPCSRVQTEALHWLELWRTGAPSTVYRNL